MKSLFVVAFGGNALKQPTEKGTSEEQFRNVGRATGYLAKLVKEGNDIVITHGNGPQIGDIVIQNEAAKNLVPVHPMDVCGAESQGQIGYMIQQSLLNHFLNLGIRKPVVSVVTQVEVDPHDEAFSRCTKPIGPFYSAEKAEELKKNGCEIIEDAGRGYRRVVPSPKPLAIVEMEAIKKLIKKDVVVICAGGGGIPVIKNEKGYSGIEAVIDKDLATSLLAAGIKADILVDLTDVEKAALNYRKPDQIFMDSITATEAEKYLKEGHFSEGSMRPKIEAAVNFIKSGGKEAIITHLFKMQEALEGKTGTHITK